MRKLIIQIPCFDEERTLAATLAELPRAVPGFDVVEWLVVDDGSGDRTAEIAREHGVDHIVRHARNRGLAAAYTTGIDACLALGADVIVNTDGDNQYCGTEIPKLVAPIVRGEADLVIGERPIWQIDDFSFFKKVLQRVGTWFVRRVSGTGVRDAPSGFRAMSREAAARLHVFNDYTYTLETIVEAGAKRLAVVSVPIRTNPATRPSRLIKGLPRYVAHSVTTTLRSTITHRPFRVFLAAAAVTGLAGLAVSARFLLDYWEDGIAGHVQSLILAALLLGVSFFLAITGFVVDLIAVNRKLLERIETGLVRLERAVDRAEETSNETVTNEREDVGQWPAGERTLAER